MFHFLRETVLEQEASRARKREAEVRGLILRKTLLIDMIYWFRVY